MGVVYFSIIPTFEPSRYCKCWRVCFHNIFADYTDYYTHGYEPVFTHYQYLTSYAVNRETGEVLREREWSDIECEWLYNEEYKKAVK